MAFDVKMTSGILYDYMLYHTYTGPSGLLGNCMGALMVVLFFYNGNIPALIGGLVVLAYTPWTLLLKSKQQMLRTASFNEPLHYELSAEGIRISQGDDTLLLEWDGLHKAVSTRQSIIVYTSKANACIFPRKDLDGQAIEVIRMLSEYLPPAKVKIKF